jgi:hypothetical protein
MVEATHKLEERIAALRERVAREDEENKQLTGEMTRYRAFRLVTLRRDAECASVRREISRWLTDGGASVIKNFTENWENAKLRLERDRPPADVLDPPEGADLAGIDRSVTDELRREGIGPPAYTRDDLARDLVPVSETAASSVGTFVDAACRAQKSADDIRTALLRINADLTPMPKRPNPT